MSPLKLDIILTTLIILLLVAMFYNHRRSFGITERLRPKLGVQELIEKVKAELIATDQKRIDENRAAMFQLREFDLDISFVVTESNTATGGLEFKVVTIGAENNVKAEEAQRIRLHMTAVPPQTRQEGPSDVSPVADDATIDVQPNPLRSKK